MAGRIANRCATISGCLLEAGKAAEEADVDGFFRAAEAARHALDDLIAKVRAGKLAALDHGEAPRSSG